MSFWKKNWWAFPFLSLLSVFYFHFYNQKKTAVKDLSFRLEKMEKQRMLALNTQEDLALRIASQDDPAWIEMILIRDLGVVPEGFLKVHFKK